MATEQNQHLTVFKEDDTATSDREADVATLIAMGVRAEYLTPLPDWALKGIIKGDIPRPDSTPSPTAPGGAGGGSTPPPGKREILVAADLLRPMEEVYWAGQQPTKWWVEGLIPLNAVTLLAGYAKDGKSTMMMSILTAASTGDKWCGMQVLSGIVWYMTEEGDNTMYELIDDVGPELIITHEGIEGTDEAPGEPPKYWMNTRHMIGSIAKWNGDWDGLCQVLAIKVEQAPAEETPTTIVIDTLGAWGNMEDTNDYAKIQKLLTPARRLRDQTGCAVVIVTHTRKNNNSDPLRSILGSAAFPGAVDHNIVITPVKDIPTQRELHMAGRFRAAEDNIIINYTGDGGFERIGETESPVLVNFGHQELTSAVIIAHMKGFGWGEKRVRREIQRLLTAKAIEWVVAPPDPNARLRRTNPTQPIPLA